MVPDTPRPFPLNLASIVEDNSVTGSLFFSSPLKVNADSFVIVSCAV
jgi:hypothetical protein